jgi:hypothetical protein
MPAMLNRRQFVTALSLTGATNLIAPRGAFAGEGPLETTAIRLVKNQGICSAPQYVAEELLHDEGFTDIRYVDTPNPEITAAIAHGKADFGMGYAPAFARDIDAGEAVTIIGGVMVGCVELFARDGIRSVTDLKGKSVGVQALGSLPNILVVLMAAYVGLDPDKDIHWVTDPNVKPRELFIDGKIDAFLGFPPEPQELRARGIGRVIVNTAVDRPWSQYYCCMLGQPGIRPEVPCRHQAHAACRPQGGGSVRHRPGERGAADRRSRVHPAIRLCLADLERKFLRQVAGIRSRGYNALLRPSVARHRIDQNESQQDYRRKHRLALLQPAQTGAEGVNANEMGGFRCR